MAKVNVSKRLRKSTIQQFSDDEISQNDSQSSYDNYDSDVDGEFHPPTKRSRASSVFSSVSKASQATTMIQRRPTRVPDPSVTNRNAKLARENRQRKKEEREEMIRMIEGLKEENARFKRDNGKLKKNEAKLMRTIQNLESIIKGQPAIANFANLLREINIGDLTPSTVQSSSGYATSETASVTSDAENGKPSSDSSIGKLVDDLINETLNDPTLDLNDFAFFEEEGLIMKSPLIDDFQPTVLTPPGSTHSPDHTYTTVSGKKIPSTPGSCYHVNGQAPLGECTECNNKASSQTCWTATI